MPSISHKGIFSHISNMMNIILPNPTANLISTLFSKTLSLYYRGKMTACSPILPVPSSHYTVLVESI